MATLDNEKQIRLFQMKVQYRALYLETKGLKKRGRSMCAILKDQYGFKGSKQKVLEQFEKAIKDIENGSNPS